MKTERELLHESAARILASHSGIAEKLRIPARDGASREIVENFRMAVEGPALEGIATEASAEFALETIVNRYGRPVLLVEGTGVRLEGPETEIWGERLGSKVVKSALSALIPAVGRIEVQNLGMDWLGTGWLVSDEIIVTNRHVAKFFGVRGATGESGFVFRQGQLDPAQKMSAQVDFREEFGVPGANEFRVVNILHIEDEPGPDMAFLRVERRNKDGVNLASPLTLSRAPAARDQYVGTVGYPAYDSRIPDHELVKRLFGDVYNVKRFAPGQIITGTSDEVTHNCSTLGGNSGSPIFDLESGTVVGLHYSGLFLRANYGVSSPTIASRLEQVREGRVFPAAIVAPGGKGELSGAPLQPKGSEPVPAVVGSPASATFTINVPLQLTVGMGVPTILSHGSQSAVPTMSASEAVRQARELLGSQRDILAVREGFVFRDGWITNEAAVVIVLRNSNARAHIRMPGSIGPFPVEIRDPGPVDFVGNANDFATEAVRETSYQKPAAFSLKAVTARMKVICHLSPDAAWPTLKAFLGGTQERLTIGMYDFSAKHIVDAVEAAVLPEPRTLELVLEDIKDSIGGKGVKEHDISDKETEKQLRDAIGDRLQYGSASVGKGRQFASAYHIKVAVRDGTAFWLSSGNWQSSNQYKNEDKDGNEVPLDQSSWWHLSNLNREWHVVVANANLAEQFEKYLRYDLKNAIVDKSQRIADESLELFVSEDRVEERVPSGAPTYFEPLDIDRDVTVQPLLTPDNYNDEVLALIESAEEQILFQNQSFSLLYDKDGNDTNDERFAALADALLSKQRAGLDVRIIIRGDFNPQTPLERLKMRGFDMARVRLQNRCHTKGIIVDGKRVLVGSHNWTNEGALVNRDASLIFHDTEIAEYFARAFWFDWKKLSRPSIGSPRRVQPVDGAESETVARGRMQRVTLATLLN